MVAGAGLCSSLRLPACRLLRRPAAAAAARRTSSSSSTAGPPPYYTVRISCPKNAADTLSESLLCFGATSASMDETDDDETIDEETFCPINVADGLWIIPAWRAPIDIEATNIILEPGLAFGTGEHPTTKLCLLLLHENINGGENFFDYGTGSGILCIAALKFGAAISFGVDIDPQAIAAARKNASLNNIRPEKMQLYLPPDRVEDLSPGGAKCENLDKPNANGWGLYQEKGKYDVVIANILLNPLVALVDEITSYAKPGGIVGLSGIICEQVPEIKECYSKYLECMSVKEMDGWACISGKRKACL